MFEKFGFRDQDGDGDVDAFDVFHTVIRHNATRVVSIVLFLAVIVAALAGLGTAIYYLMADHMKMGVAASIFNAGVVSVGTLVLAIGAWGSARERTRAALRFWFIAFALVAVSMVVVYGALSASAIVLTVGLLETVGKIVAPMPAALMVLALGATMLTLRGPDNEHANATLFAMFAKLVLVLFSSFGILNLALRSQNINQQAFGVFLAVVVELTFVALVFKRERPARVEALTWTMGGVMGLNAIETVAYGLGFALPSWLTWLPEVGKVAIRLSGLLAVMSIIVLSKHDDDDAPRSQASASRPSFPFGVRRPTGRPSFGEPRPNIPGAPGVPAARPVGVLEVDDSPVQPFTNRPARPVDQDDSGETVEQDGTDGDDDPSADAMKEVNAPKRPAGPASK